MTHKVLFTHNSKRGYKPREGTEIYRHPKGYFVVLEFEGESGKFRETFWPEEVVKDKLFL